jgi:two-component system, cell cycle sensor histidine kinase and response regulator CckA
MSPFSHSLREAQASLSENISSRLRELIFENRYSLHPRRLAGAGKEQADVFLLYLDDPSQADPSEQGKKLAREGFGVRPILAMTETLRLFCRRQLQAEPAALGDALDAAERYCSALLEGFMAAQEDLILQDQEQLRRALSTALENQSRELLVKNHAVSTSINGIMLTDLGGKVTWVNSSFLAMWGYDSASEVSGMAIPAFWAGEEAQRALESLLSSGGGRGELDARRRDGKIFTVELSASIIRNEEGTAIGIMTSFVDATERKRLQAQIIQAQKMEALGQLAGGITHDFNNLLTAVGGFVQLLMDQAPRDSRMHHDLMQIQAAVDRGTGLTRQLRFFTRQTAGNRAVVSLNDSVRETWEILKHAFPPEIRIRLDLAPSLDMIEADPNQMSQVLMNLCVNARDAMTEAGSPPGGTLSIETANLNLAEEKISRYATARPGDYVAVRVRDTGTGIAADVQDRLFIPFITTKSARSGTGLGLAVVYGIVTNHQGFIDVHSAPGRGTEFELLFPRTVRAREGTKPEAAAALVRGSGTVLVVDDEQQIREVMRRVLADCGYTVISAGDGREALERYGQGIGIDLVILDVIMPILGGKECLAELRKRNPAVRVLVTTGYTSDGTAHGLLQEGAMGIIEKPLDLKAFAQTVARHISPR